MIDSVSIFPQNWQKLLMNLKFIQGIQVTSDREWYASVMLNRLMFKDKQNSVIK